MEDLKTVIARAQEVLSQAFGTEDPQERVGSDAFVQLATLRDAYKKELTQSLDSEFDEIFNNIQAFQSSYLPVELVNQIFQDTKVDNFESIQDDLSLKESQENTFMRLLGMPLSDDGTLGIAEDVNTINPDNGQETEISIEEVQRDILDQRQLASGDREVRVDLDSLMTSLVEGDADNIDLTQIESSFFKTSYLLIPPIQDARISKCISETNKIVAKPFSSEGSRLLNRSSLQPTLLESIIKIRLDRSTGTTAFGDVVDTVQGEEVTPANSYGVLESLFIIRLRSALGGLARRLLEIRDDANEQILNSQLTTRGENNPNEEQHGAKTQEVEGLDNSEEEKALEAQQVFERSIFSLLENNAEISGLPSQSNRSNSIISGPLVSSVTTLVGLPGKRVDRRLNDIRKKKNDSSGKLAEPLRKEVGQMFGTRTGVGLVDIIVFNLALFSVDEESLLGLLSEESYNNLRNSSLGNLIVGSGEKLDTQTAVNNLTARIIEGYREFIRELSEDLTTRSNPLALNTLGSTGIDSSSIV
jgi:hypothetical protein